MDLVLASLDRVTPLDLDEGGRVTLRGVVTTTLDGSSFDAVAQWAGSAAATATGPGLFDLEAGGLRVVEQHPGRHEYTLTATGTQPLACAVTGARACLVPRLGLLAHERLRTEDELGQTLSGGIAVEGPPPPSFASVAFEVGARAAAFLAGLLVVAALAAAVMLLHRRSRTTFARVRSAARRALASSRGDPSFSALRAQVVDLVTRARQVEADRRALARALRRVDRAGLQSRIDAHSPSDPVGSSPTADVVEWLRRERDDADRLARDHQACVVELERIACALRVVALHARERRDPGGPAWRVDPVDAVALELELRAAAATEADRAVG